MTAGESEESAHALRHTVATRLLRDHAPDLVLVDEIPATPTSRPRGATRAPDSSSDAPHSNPRRLKEVPCGLSTKAPLPAESGRRRSPSSSVPLVSLVGPAGGAQPR